jgi:hypothetical protein
MPFRTRLFLFAAVCSVVAPIAASAQSLDLSINNTGLSIGDSRFVRGIRINFRDENLRRVEGVNITVWSPYEPARGEVKGLALGLPLTGARRIDGAGLGIFGVSASESFTGIGFGGFGVGAGQELEGIMVGGFGVGTGGDLRGITIAGFGAGAGSSITGLTIGGFGAGSGGSIRGITIAGFGAGSGGGLEGLTIAGFGAGSGGDVRGITLAGFGVGGGGHFTGLQIAGIGVGGGGGIRGVSIAGIGVGSGGDVTGISIGGVGVGAGGTLRGYAAGLVGVGAPRIRGIVTAGAAGGHDVVGGVIAPVYFKIENDGRVKGLTISAFNHIKGEQFGLSIGLLNHAWELHGWQIGVLNYAANNPPGLRLLPLFNREWSPRR